MNNCTYIFIDICFHVFINVYVHIGCRCTVQCGIVSACVCAHACNHISTRFHRHDPAYSLQYAASKNVPFLKQQDNILEILKRFPMF